MWARGDKAPRNVTQMLLSNNNIFRFTNSTDCILCIICVQLNGVVCKNMNVMFLDHRLTHRSLCPCAPPRRAWTAADSGWLAGSCSSPAPPAAPGSAWPRGCSVAHTYTVTGSQVSSSRGVIRLCKNIHIHHPPPPPPPTPYSPGAIYAGRSFDLCKQKRENYPNWLPTARTGENNHDCMITLTLSNRCVLFIFVEKQN